MLKSTALTTQALSSRLVSAYTRPETFNVSSFIRRFLSAPRRPISAYAFLFYFPKEQFWSSKVDFSLVTHAILYALTGYVLFAIGDFWYDKYKKDKAFNRGEDYVQTSCVALGLSGLVLFVMAGYNLANAGYGLLYIVITMLFTVVALGVIHLLIKIEPDDRIVMQYQAIVGLFAALLAVWTLPLWFSLLIKEAQSKINLIHSVSNNPSLVLYAA